ncbi:MAG: O-antigen ligase family protein [Parcubacteria group bacterium]|jgi:O-antigen ligase
MLIQLKSFVNKINSAKYYLLAVNIILVGALIMLANFGILPFKKMSDFIFFAGIGFIFALYRPGWSFLFFIGTIALENINLAPKELGVAIRPYQFLGFLTFVAVGVRYYSRRLNFKLPKFRWTEYLIILLVLGGFLGSLNALNGGIALKQSIIILSFGLLYFLVRVFIQNLDDIKRIIPFFLSSSTVIIIYGIWQNWQFMRGKNNFEVMAGRTNATFTEADWFGIFLVFLLSILYVVVYNLYSKIKIFELERRRVAFAQVLFSGFLIILSWIALIITVSRSAWLGVAVITLGVLSYWILKKKVKLILIILASILIAFASVYFLKLTNFQLDNRIQSTTSGQQKITIACGGEVQIPGPIDDITQLKQYGCEHINLEDIKKEQSTGRVIKEIYRKDPNVSIRAKIYKKSWNEIKNHPIFGIGWGNIADILGKDERGTGLNSSNIFLEVWLGAGIIGLLSFAGLVGYILGRGKWFFLKKLKEGKFFREDSEMDFFCLFLILSATAIIVPNLFNAGIMLGFLWAWMGIVMVRE